MNKIFPTKTLSAHEAITEAQRIAYAPMVFQAVRSLRELGILGALDIAGKSGTTMAAIATELGLSRYGVGVLVESGVSAGVIDALGTSPDHSDSDDYFALSKVGYFLLHDPMTRVNMDFNHAICYEGLHKLDEAVTTGKPAGLAAIDKQHETVYEALRHLPDNLQKSWYAFDHFYSDVAYPAALKMILERKPTSLVDIGANQGRFSILAAQTDDAIQITMVDLPEQLSNGQALTTSAGFADRIDGVGMDIREASKALPAGRDAYWLSQFICCFSEDEIVSILERVATAMTEQSNLYILETCWDRQREEAAAFALVNTSLYFTCIANGNSKMYSAEDLLKCIDKAGLHCDQLTDGVGNYHTLFSCSKAPTGQARS